jgi:hypothetical protein
VVELGDVPILYVQPGTAEADIASTLESRGPCVYSLVTAVPDCHPICAAAAANGVAVSDVPRPCEMTLEFLGMMNTEARQLQSFGELGVEISLVRASA